MNNLKNTIDIIRTNLSLLEEYLNNEKQNIISKTQILDDREKN